MLATAYILVILYGWTLPIVVGGPFDGPNALNDCLAARTAYIAAHPGYLGTVACQPQGGGLLSR